MIPEPGNVLFLDYETDVDTFWERVNMITGGLGVTIPDGLYYRHMVEPLVGDIDGVKAATRDHGIELLIVDSAAPAVLEPEDWHFTTNSRPGSKLSRPRRPVPASLRVTA